jgi:mRNA interferase MazF
VICDFGDIVIVPFPFVDRPIAKVRPALVVSKERFNADNDHSILAMITTGARSAWPSDIEIRDRTSAGIDHRSVVRWKIFTVPNQIVMRVIGKLGLRDRSIVAKAVRQHLST